ncbi:MAG: tetratricopeptide repeat protein [Alphaproteobacteria bacterium]|nr:tetratricopeptide repeat protein [Alphaproteobacteria bacterium]
MAVRRDSQGLEVAGASADAVAAIDFLTDEWLRQGNRLAGFLETAGRDADVPLTQMLAACLCLTMDSPDGEKEGLRFLAAARAAMRAAGPRECGWLAAMEAWAAGDNATAFDRFEALVREWPRDLLALKMGQLHAFNRGDSEGLLRIAEIAWAANPDRSHVRGMRAFGLEECNRLDEAEAEARAAVETDRRDPWSHHAVAHCLEARGRMDEGVAWMASVADTWEGCNSFMLTHNWWHVALFEIDRDRTDAALELFDRRVWGVWKEFCQDQINAVSLLARLELRGVDAGPRWADIATYLAPRLHEHYSPFLDLHYLYGLARAGRDAAVTEMLASLEDRAARAQPFERKAWRDAAVPAAHGLAAHARGDMGEAARLLGLALPSLPAIGGSHAQRALFGALHLDALMHADWNDAALAILRADERDRPRVAATKRSIAAICERLGRAQEAAAARLDLQRLSTPSRSRA